MNYDFRKTGIKIFIISILIIILMGMMNVELNIRLFVSTILIGISIFLTFFGDFSPPNDDDY